MNDIGDYEHDHAATAEVAERQVRLAILLIVEANEYRKRVEADPGSSSSSRGLATDKVHAACREFGYQWANVKMVFDECERILGDNRKELLTGFANLNQQIKELNK